MASSSLAPTAQVPATSAPRPRKSRSPAGRPAWPKDALQAQRMARRLESDWRLALEHHEDVVGRQFHLLRTALRSKPRKGDAAVVRDVTKVRKDLDAKLKPKRGRAKDLKRVENALSRALGRLDAR